MNLQRTVWTPGGELGYPLLHSAGPQVVELGPVEGPELPRALEDLVFQASLFQGQAFVVRAKDRVCVLMNHSVQEIDMFRLAPHESPPFPEPFYRAMPEPAR